MIINKERWGNVSGKGVFLFTLKNNNGVEVSITNYGAIITSLIMPDKYGERKNVVLGYNALDEYIQDKFYLGCVVGRVANRISNAEFFIDGKIYKLALNDIENSCHLHGGNVGFSKKVFNVHEFENSSHTSFLKLSYRSPHMEEGYPGNVNLIVTYSLNENNEFLIDYYATTDTSTHINLTNHSYFNLSGTNRKAIVHELYINSERYLETNSQYLPTGKTLNVKDTPFDFTTRRVICNVSADTVSMFNECYDLNGLNIEVCAAELFDAVSNRSIKLYTTAPGVLFYSGFGLDGDFSPCQGVCLETQFFPNAANHSCFASTLVKPGEAYHQQTKWCLRWD